MVIIAAIIIMPVRNLYNEPELLQCVAQGDQVAFSEVVRYYTPIIYRRIMMYVKNSLTAQELTQDVFISIWQNRAKLAGMDNFSGYIYVIARNKAFRGMQTVVEHAPEPPDDTIQTLLHTPEISTELKDLARILNNGIDRLPKRRKQVFKMSRIDQLTHDQIASELSISKSAVNQHITEAMVFLRTYLKEMAQVIVSLLGFFCVNNVN